VIFGRVGALLYLNQENPMCLKRFCGGRNARFRLKEAASHGELATQLFFPNLRRIADFLVFGFLLQKSS
jgi:hypothetical protein